MALSIAELYIYPVKSCAGLKLDEARVADTGFEHDREWMVIRPNGWFITQRQFPRMALIQPALLDKGLRLSAPGTPDVEVSARTEAAASTLDVRVWDDTIQAVDQGDTVASWLSNFLGAPCRLVRISGERPLGEKYRIRGTEKTQFADGFPFLFVSQASLDDLNGRMEVPVPVTRFRPNIVVGGGSAFQEDDWNKVRVTSLTFRLPKPCTRCEIITIDQATAIKEVEPMETLSSYRYQTKGIVFGKNGLAEQTGMIHVGDELVVID